MTNIFLFVFKNWEMNDGYTFSANILVLMRNYWSNVLQCVRLTLTEFSSNYGLLVLFDNLML